MKKTILFAIALLVSYVSCIGPTSPSEDREPSTAVRILSLGDSYTIGESVPVADRWSVQLAERLHKSGVEAEAPRIIARTGWTTAELLEAIRKTEDLDKNYDLVTLLIGVNNQYRGQSEERYRTELRELLRLSIGFAKNRPSRVVMLSTPDWGVTPFAASRNRPQIALEIDRFNAVAKEECLRAGIAFVDITPVSRTALDRPEMVAEDRLHFSGKMYGLWAEAAQPVVTQLLSQKSK